MIVRPKGVDGPEALETRGIGDLRVLAILGCWWLGRFWGPVATLREGLKTFTRDGSLWTFVVLTRQRVVGTWVVEGYRVLMALLVG